MGRTIRIQCAAVGSFLIAVVAFILIAFGSEMFNLKASTTLTTTTVDNEMIQILVLTDTGYDAAEWLRIERTIKSVARRSNFEELDDAIYKAMKKSEWSTHTISSSKLVYKVTR